MVERRRRRQLPGRLEERYADIGPIAKMKEDFVQAGVTQFGSGWCWLAVKDGKITVTKTPNGENPLVHGATPILGCDVWEHSYYIDYRDRRPDYLEAFLDRPGQLGLCGRDVQAAMKSPCSAAMRSSEWGLWPRFLVGREELGFRRDCG